MGPGSGCKREKAKKKNTANEGAEMTKKWEAGDGNSFFLLPFPTPQSMDFVVVVVVVVFVCFFFSCLFFFFFFAVSPPFSPFPPLPSLVPGESYMYNLIDKTLQMVPSINF